MSDRTERQLAERLRRLFAQQDQARSRTPAFRLTLDAAAARAATIHSQRLRLVWSGAAAAVALTALFMLLARNTTAPTLEQDLVLAQSVSYDAVWRSPSDRLMAATTSPLMRNLPAMPRPGSPESPKEYL